MSANALNMADPESVAIRVFAEKNAHSGESAALGAAVSAENAPIDPELRSIIERWPDLPDAVKAGILAMVRAASTNE